MCVLVLACVAIQVGALGVVGLIGGMTVLVIMSRRRRSSASEMHASDASPSELFQ